MAFLLIVLITFYCQTTNTWPPKLAQKIETALAQTFTDASPSLQAVDVSSESYPLPVSNHLFRVQDGDNTLGFAYVGQAPSLKNQFDYIVLLDDKLQVINAKVLIYREQHGRQIGSKRWLKQFYGMDRTDRPELYEEVDGISGATISCRSMTEAVRDVLATVDQLGTEKVIRLD